MSKYLISVKETYRLDTKDEALAFIEENEHDGRYVSANPTMKYKEVKEKKEVVDSYFLVTLTKKFDNDKEPTGNIDIEYVEKGAF